MQHCRGLRAMTREGKDEDAGGQGATGATGRGSGIQGTEAAWGGGGQLLGAARGRAEGGGCPWTSSRAPLLQPEAGAHTVPEGSPVPLRLAVIATSDPERHGGSRDTEESCRLNLGMATICPSQG